MQQLKISLVILTLNEIQGLTETFKGIPLDAVDEVFAVDGGSKDGTVEFLKEKSVTVISQEKKGRGEAFRLAFAKSNGDAIIFYSPDGNEDPADIRKFRNILENGADIAIGNRMSHGGRNEEDSQIFKFRKWANNAFTFLANLFWNKGPYVSDTINGYRAITRSAWQSLELDGEGYTIEFQMSIRAMKKNLKIVEFPTIESARIDGREGSPSISTGIAFLKTLIKEFKRD